MRIISKFKDYYDGIQGLGFDDNLVFVRHTIEKEINEKEVNSLLQNRNRLHFDTYQWNDYKSQNLFPNMKKYKMNQYDNIIWDIKTNYLIFCGKIYIYYVANINFKTNIYAWCLDDLIKYLDMNVKYSKDTSKYHFFINSSGYKNEYSRFEASFEENKDIDMTDLCIKYNCPIILIQSLYTYSNQYKIVLNPELKNMGFQRVFAPYQAYQEIEMFLGNILVNDKDKMIKLSDKDRLHKAGFDKWSFRKMKEN